MRLRPILCFSRRTDEREPKLAEDRVGHRRRRAGQGVGAARDLWERGDLAEVRLAREQGDEAVDAHREAAMRRRAHLERVEEEAELVALLLLAHAHDPEDGLLKGDVVDSDRARAELPAVPDEVIVLAEDAGRVGFDPMRVVRKRRRERVMRERPALALLVVLEER